jgi:hypothetical protein
MIEFLLFYFLAAILEPVVGALDRVNSPRDFAFTAIISVVAMVWAFIPGLRLLALGCVGILLTSCVAARGEGWTYASLGTDSVGLSVTATGLSAANINQSESVKHGVQAMKDITRIKGLMGLGGAAIKEMGDIGNSLVK